MSGEDLVCPRCSRLIRFADSAVFSRGQIAHLSCPLDRPGANGTPVPEQRPGAESRREVER